MLAVVQIRAFKPRATPYKVPDVDGLFLLIQPSGGLYRRFRFRAHGSARYLDHLRARPASNGVAGQNEIVALSNDGLESDENRHRIRSVVG